MVSTERAMARTGADGGASIRWVNVAIGIWLFISAFIWPHTTAQQTNTWILGILIALVGLWAMAVPKARFVNTVLAIWLFFATLFLPHETAGTLWNNLIAALVVFLVSLVPTGSSRVTHGTRPVHA